MDYTKIKFRIKSLYYGTGVTFSLVLYSTTPHVEMQTLGPFLNGYAKYIKLCILQLRSIHKQVFHFFRSTSLMCTGKRWHIRMLHQFGGKTQNIFFVDFSWTFGLLKRCVFNSGLTNSCVSTRLFTYQTIRPN